MRVAAVARGRAVHSASCRQAMAALLHLLLLLVVAAVMMAVPLKAAQKPSWLRYLAFSSTLSSPPRPHALQRERGSALR